MLFIKNRLNTIDKKLKLLKDKNNRIILEFITNLENNNSELYHILKVVDRDNEVLYSKEIRNDKPSKYISDVIDKYKCNVDIEFYDIINNQKIKTF